MNHQNEENLHEAVFSGNMATVQKILQRNPSCVNHWNLEFRTPLHMVYHPVYFYNPATADERLSIMQVLIEYGVDVNMRGGYINLETALHMVVKKKQDHKTCILLEILSEKSVHLHDIMGKPDLHLAVCEGEEAVVEALLREGADVNARDVFFETPLHLLSMNKKPSRIACLLVKYGVDETTLMCSYPTALPLLYVCSYYELIVAIALRYKQVIHRLIEMDYIVEKNTNHCQDINRALKEAVFTRQYDIINILLESGFQIDRRFPHDVPRFSAVYQTGCNLRTVCLFREFQDSAMIGQATIDIIDKVLARRPIVNELMNLLVFYYAMDLHLNKVNVDLIPLQGLFESCKELSEILDKCSDQLSGLKTFKVESKSLYDIVLMQQGSLVKLLNNENYVDASIEKMEVLKMAKDNLNRALQGVLSTVDFVNLPDKITMKILTHLHMRELKKIAETSEVDPLCINDWNLEFKTPLHMVYDHINDLNPVQADDRLPIMQLLINYGADVNTRGPRHESALHLAVRKQQINGIKLLLENHSNPDIPNEYNGTALHFATHYKPGIIMKLLIKYKANLNTGDTFGNTPLDMTIRHRNLNFFKILVKYSAKSLHIYDMISEVCDGSSKQRDQLFLKYLLKHASRLDINRNFSPKALSYYLISKKHPRYHRGKSNEPELYEIIISIVWGNVEVVDHLLDTYFNNEIKRNSCQDANRALSLATQTGQYKIVKLLLESGFRADERFPSQVPHFDATNSIEDNLKIICLFWEFQDGVTISRAIINAFRRIVLDEPVTESSYLLVLEESKKFKAGNMTFYDILTMPLNKIVRWLNNPMYFDNFSLYSSILEEKRDLEYIGITTDSQVKYSFDSTPTALLLVFFSQANGSMDSARLELLYKS
ncbi:uncharacterized protein LOC106643967 [Copidosoma floridanum]|uniref:uncharacterized protein LOC106643967 n=1 Tax=Copidosoma floridanum TaxID=29053 RepID=UPI0006C9649D|nr:uncharacterized protein LOC106643967 [Copidosoma floridanum]